MVLNERRLRYTINPQCLVSVEIGPSELERVEEILQVFLENDIHTALLLIVETKHELVGARGQTLDHVV